MGPDEMKVRLTRKLAESIDGVDLSHKRVGKIINVERHNAQLLIAEGWGAPADTVGERSSDIRSEARPRTGRITDRPDSADDRPPRRRAASKSRKPA
jgi:hypothetical protein